ncbi:Ig-like domain-containing protein [Yersinia rohdei]|uniref:Ig-like domain-containing protein n=1 Tax=Yersinia rohdei TaxID=29485 RepID=UPI0028F40F1E|nr:Ig-like domain-containing protein [Yersinia rohdei]
MTGVTLNKTTVSVAVGNTGNLIPTITPQNATDKTGVFSSSEPETATIDPGTGEYEGVAAGTTDLTFTTNDGAKTAVCVLTVTA